MWGPAFVVAGVVAGLGAIGCGPGGAGAGPPFPIVLVSIDTLRSDHLPAYGYRGVETPAIDGLARDGVLYENAWSHYPLTLPSHVSILTGLLPPQHGVRDNSGYRLAAGLPFLPRDLHAAGYATAGAVSAFVLRGATGLADGFDLYDDTIALRQRTGLGGQQRPGEETLAALDDWLAARDERPFFLFLHLYEPHTPYRPPAPFAERYAGAPYDGEIATADQILGRLLGELRRRDLYERSAIVLLSDHGEGLGDHGEAEHGVLLYREALQVPLIVKPPAGWRGRGEGGGGSAGRRVATPVELVDVYPTLAAFAGLPPRHDLPGVSLLELADHPRPRRLYAETFYPRLHFGWSDLASVTDGRLHYLHAPTPELFDLTSDPGERHDVLGDSAGGAQRDLLATHRRAYAALRQTALDRRVPLAAPSAEDAATRASLASLGYLGGAAAAGDGPLPDPRHHLAALGELERGMALAAAGRAAEAVPVLESLVAREPGMVDAWESLGRAWQGLGEPQRALDAYRQALSRSRAAPQIALAAAALLLESGRVEEAAEHARLALDADPAGAHEVLARAALAAHDVAEAERQAQAALTAAPGEPASLAVWAEVQRDRGDLAGALASVERAERAAAPSALPGAGSGDGRSASRGESRSESRSEVRSDGTAPPDDRVRGLALLRGGILARMGRTAEAESAFRTEIRRDPSHPRAYSELALLLALAGRTDEAVATLRQLTVANDTPGAYAAAVRTLRVLGDPRSADALRRHALARFPASVALHRLATEATDPANGAANGAANDPAREPARGAAG